MKFFIKQSFISVFNSLPIYDDIGREIFSIRRDLNSFKNKVVLMDLNQNPLALIEKRVFAFPREFDIYTQNDGYSHSKKKFSLLGHHYEVEGTNGKYEIEGKPLGHKFYIYKDGSIIANVSKNWLSLNKIYNIDIEDSENQAFILALIMTTDASIYSDKHRFQLFNFESRK